MQSSDSFELGPLVRRPSGSGPAQGLSRVPAWLRVAGVVFAVGWGANQFSSLLLAYRLHSGVSESTADALFGVYALGLIPALLILGPVSDVRGRRGLLYGAGAGSGVATLALIAGQHHLVLLYLGRFVAGVCSGAAFAAGTAWIKELSAAPYDLGATAQAGARRAAIALSAGFGCGALVAGLLAQWAPDPLLVSYLPHLAVTALTLIGLSGAPETVPRTGRGISLGEIVRVPGAGSPRFRRVVIPTAPWVFVAPSVAFAVLPGLVAHGTGSFAVGFAALIAGLTLTLGILIQPVAHRLATAGDLLGTVTGLAAVGAGCLVGALAAHLDSWPLVIPAAVLLGCGFGLSLVSGLIEIQKLADPGDLAALTALYYALTYIGFAAPIVLAELQHLVGAPTLLVIAAVILVATLAEVLRIRSRTRPGRVQL